MPLAGRMKLSHFVVLAIVLVGAAIVGLVKACGSGHDEVPAPTVAVAPTPAPTQPAPSPTTPSPRPPSPTTPTTTTTTSVAKDGELPARAWDAEILAWRTRGIRGDKEKDVTKGKSYKVNVYKDAGNATVNRAKVDLDRDDKFDEKYTFEASKITLQRAPADDEKYTETYHWTGSAWARE